MGSFWMSNGERVKKSIIDRRVREAKKKILDAQMEEHGHNFCTICEINSNNAIIDCAHIMSVDDCQNNGMAEVAWDLDNINPMCRACHRKHDRTTIG